jgi:hypothetical protein
MNTEEHLTLRREDKKQLLFLKLYMNTLHLDLASSYVLSIATEIDT